jgi:hypothetical protein
LQEDTQVLTILEFMFNQAQLMLTGTPLLEIITIIVLVLTMQM